LNPVAKYEYIQDLKQVEEMCDYVYWLDNGTIRSSGQPDEVVPEYREFMAKSAAN